MDDHVEPSYDAKADCQILTGNGISNGVIKANDRDILAVNGLCKNITQFNTGQGEGNIDLTSTHQNFIFGLGPTSRSIRSDSESADIRRHALYGQFTMDLSKATVDNAQDVDQARLGGVSNWENSNAQLAGGVTSDFDWSGPAHAVFMGGAFVILFPLGVIFLRLVEKVRWHAWMQGTSAAIAVFGVGIGIYLGRQYNHVSRLLRTNRSFTALLVY